MSIIEEGSLVRTRGGAVIHRTGCLSVLKSLPRSRPVRWMWAEGRERDDVLATIKYFDYQICKDCTPFHLED